MGHETIMHTAMLRLRRHVLWAMKRGASDEYRPDDAMVNNDHFYNDNNSRIPFALPSSDCEWVGANCVRR